MIVRNLISNDFPALKLTDTVQLALITMEDLQVKNLAVVENGSVLGYALNTNLESLDPLTTLASAQLHPPYILNPDYTLFMAIKVFAESDFDTLAVGNGNYMGVIWIKDLIRALGNSITSGNDGAVLLLKCSSHDYSVSQLGRLIESEDGKILGLWIWQNETPGMLEIMLKLNIHHIDNLSLLLSGRGYEVIHKVNHNDVDFNEDRYQSLIKYLDI